MMQNSKTYKGNLGFMFYKHYYRDDKMNSLIDGKGNIIDSKELNNKNSYILDSKTKTQGTNLDVNNIGKLLKKDSRVKTLLLRTTYPGLLIGSGLLHGIRDDEAFKIGFQFDYTTGLPVIPGSSIKGVLRSAFPTADDRCKEDKEQYIKEVIKDITGKVIDSKFIEKLKKRIFEGKKNGSYLPVCDRDVFFDAEIYNGDKDGGILGEDFITPHPDPLKNPKPIKFLKILPEVVFKFTFILNDNNDLLKAEDKLKLFKLIILNLGIGAKTNVGYGNLEEIRK